jgi:hypothetical protein
MAIADSRTRPKPHPKSTKCPPFGPRALKTLIKLVGLTDPHTPAIPLWQQPIVTVFRVLKIRFTSVNSVSPKEDIDRIGCGCRTGIVFFFLPRFLPMDSFP